MNIIIINLQKGTNRSTEFLFYTPVNKFCSETRICIVSKKRTLLENFHYFVQMCKTDTYTLCYVLLSVSAKREQVINLINGYIERHFLTRSNSLAGLRLRNNMFAFQSLFADLMLLRAPRHKEMIMLITREILDPVCY